MTSNLSNGRTAIASTEFAARPHGLMIDGDRPAPVHAIFSALRKIRHLPRKIPGVTNHAVAEPPDTGALADGTVRGAQAAGRFRRR